MSETMPSRRPDHAVQRAPSSLPAGAPSFPAPEDLEDVGEESLEAGERPKGASERRAHRATGALVSAGFRRVADPARAAEGWRRSRPGELGSIASGAPRDHAAGARGVNRAYEPLYAESVFVASKKTWLNLGFMPVQHSGSITPWPTHRLCTAGARRAPVQACARLQRTRAQQTRRHSRRRHHGHARSLDAVARRCQTRGRIVACTL